MFRGYKLPEVSTNRPEQPSTEETSYRSSNSGSNLIEVDLVPEKLKSISNFPFHSKLTKIVSIFYSKFIFWGRGGAVAQEVERLLQRTPVQIPLAVGNSFLHLLKIKPIKFTTFETK